MHVNEVVILAGARTPIGAFQGSLASVPVTKLGSVAIAAAVKKSGIPSDKVDEVFMGCALQAGCGQAPARQAAIGAGLSLSTPCTTIHKVCSSGLKAITLAAQSLMLGCQEVIVAGGMESMSNAPYYMPRGSTPYGGIELKDALLCDGLTDSYGNGHMGLCTEKVAKKMNITRVEQDEYAITSFKRTIAAAESGILRKEIEAVTIPGRRGKPDTVVDTDDEYKKFDMEKLRKLSPAFLKEDGTVTAANASSLSDGAAACVLATRSYADKMGLKPLARITGFSDAATEPVDFPIAPALAVTKILEKKSLVVGDIDLWEINEPFSVAAIGNMKILALDESKVNVHGGAISLGHPIGMSGARIVNRLVDSLASGQRGIATICNGGGGATALLVEKL